MSDDASGFGARLLRQRLAAGFSQEDLASRSGLSTRTIRGLERGRTRRPYPDSVRRLADALGLSGHDREMFFGSAPRRLPAGGGESELTGPAQLPAAVRPFIGRDNERAELTSLLAHAGERPGAVIATISGTPGVGKTALAVMWAHQVAGQFPDGQLYVDLHGYDLDLPVPPGDALAGFLRALGVPGTDIPASTGERAAVYRSLLARRRMLVVIDNAFGTESVRPLLPGSVSCLTLITSRNMLSGLVVRDGAIRLELDLLSAREGLDLLRELIGHRVSEDPAAAGRLVECCGRLPLALRIAAEFAASRPGASLAALAGELSGLRHRLDLLGTADDERSTVRSVISWSYRSLDPAVARAFRLAGLHPGPAAGADAIAALSRSTPERAGLALRELARAHLVHDAGSGAGPARYQMHDLMRAYARERAADEDGDAECQAALSRLVDFYLYNAAAAMDRLLPSETARRPRITRTDGYPAVPVADETAARDWLDTELPCLVAVTEYAAGHGWPDHATRLSATLFRYLDFGGHLPEARKLHGSAIAAATVTGDLDARADALMNLAICHARLGELGRARTAYQDALACSRRAGNRLSEIRAVGNLGIVAQAQGRDGQAAGYFHDALRLSRELGDQSQELRALTGLGTSEIDLGRYRSAAIHLRDAALLCRQTGDQTCHAQALIGLADIAIRQGRYQRARAHLGQARAVCGQIGDKITDVHAVHLLGVAELREGRYPRAAELFRAALATDAELRYQLGEATTLCFLGLAEARLGGQAGAVAHVERALELSRQAENSRTEVIALNALAEIALLAGDTDVAGERHAEALELAVAIADEAEQARAHLGLGRALTALGDRELAGQHLTEAAIRYTELDAPEAREAQAELSRLGVSPPTEPADAVPQHGQVNHRQLLLPGGESAGGAWSASAALTGYQIFSDLCCCVTLTESRLTATPC